MATKKTTAEWWSYLGDGARTFTFEELAAVEQLILRDLITKLVNMADEQLAISRQALAIAEQAKHHAARTDGRLERIELFLSRQSEAYPLAQRDAPDYPAFKRSVKNFEAAKQAVLSGEDDD